MFLCKSNVPWNPLGNISYLKLGNILKELAGVSVNCLEPGEELEMPKNITTTVQTLGLNAKSSS